MPLVAPAASALLRGVGLAHAPRALYAVAARERADAVQGVVNGADEGQQKEEQHLQSGRIG